MRRARRGAGLAEFVVAFAIATLVSAAVAAAFLGAERHLRGATSGTGDRRTLREVESVLSAELRAVSADSLQLRGDTAVEFLGLVGTSVACVVVPGVLVLPPALASSGLPFSVWRATPEAGDVVAAFDTIAGGSWRTTFVDSVALRADGAGCTPASGLLSASDSALRRPATRLTLRSLLGSGIVVGAPVRLLRRARYVLTFGSDRTWSLSYRRCDAPGVCGASQPVVGPLASAADSGLSFTMAADSTRLEATIRTPLRTPGLPRDSRHLVIALRNRAPGAP